MKELTIEEKAKAYDKVREKIAIRFGSNVAEEIFSEFEESEDERIRKAILELVKQSSEILEKKNQEQMLAWLEKQGEQNLVNTDLDELVIQLEETIGTSPHSRKIIKDFFQKAVQKYMNCLRIANGEIGSLVEENYRLKEKQGDQKPQGKSELEIAKEEKVDNQNCVKQNDKVEPKFKVGDWVVTNQGKVNQVVSVDKDSDGYTLDDGGYFSGSWCDMYRLWTIQDAKPGDMLNSIRVKATIIFKEWNLDGKHIDAYCALQKGVLIKQEILWDRDFEPATKEQRDFLFKKMKDAGYEWDATKKELKKIEQNLTWSEDDEKIYNRIYDIVHSAAFSNCEVDEDGKERGEYAKMAELLKLLKDKIQPQPKQEWGEEDKGNLLDVKCIIDEVWHNQDVREEIDHSGEELESLWHWLDNIWQRVEYPQNRWKPSDEQLRELQTVSTGREWFNKEVLKELLEQLKKL